MPLKGLIAMIVAVAIGFGCVGVLCSVSEALAQPVVAPEAASIGMATMAGDGTIIVDIRAESSQGDIGDVRIVYPPTHPRYQNVLRHLGGLLPGEKKPVPPWPESK